jgi:hypothetical protein
MFAQSQISISGQLIVALALLLGLNSTANANAKNRSGIETYYKVERCDCFSFNDNIPTFLSDLTGGQDLAIGGEGKSLDEAKKQAKNMCVESYRSFASVDQLTDDVTESGCHQFRSTEDGTWVSI